MKISLRFADIAGIDSGPDRRDAPMGPKRTWRTWRRLNFDPRGAAKRRGKFWRRQVASRRTGRNIPDERCQHGRKEPCSWLLRRDRGAVSWTGSTCSWSPRWRSTSLPIRARRKCRPRLRRSAQVERPLWPPLDESGLRLEDRSGSFPPGMNGARCVNANSSFACDVLDDRRQ